jgi:hypothetical protein
MSDDKRNPGRADRSRINVNEEYELRDWSKKFGVSKEELVAAVKCVAPMVSDVEVALRKGTGANG